MSDNSNKLRDILDIYKDGGTVDLVWGPAPSVEEIDKDVDDIYPLDLKIEGEVFQPYVRPDYGRIPEDKL
jgi:hypothetical protein